MLSHPHPVIWGGARCPGEPERGRVRREHRGMVGREQPEHVHPGFIHSPEDHPAQGSVDTPSSRHPLLWRPGTQVKLTGYSRSVSRPCGSWVNWSTGPLLLKTIIQGAWVAQSVERLTSAQVMISPSVSSSPALGSMLTARSLEPTSNSVCVSLSQNIKKKKKIIRPNNAAYCRNFRKCRRGLR